MADTVTQADRDAAEALYRALHPDSCDYMDYDSPNGGHYGMALRIGLGQEDSSVYVQALADYREALTLALGTPPR